MTVRVRRARYGPGWGEPITSWLIPVLITGFLPELKSVYYKYFVDVMTKFFPSDTDAN